MALGPAEQQVLWKVEGQLEKTLDEVLLPDYQARVIAARKSILGKEDPDDETTCAVPEATEEVAEMNDRRFEYYQKPYYTPDHYTSWKEVNDPWKIGDPVFPPPM